MFLEYFSLIANFICSRFDIYQKCFGMFKALKPQEWTIFIFFQTSFFLTKCASFLLKIGEDFNIDDYKGNRI
jgi:hypothetical protein